MRFKYLDDLVKSARFERVAFRGLLTDPGGYWALSHSACGQNIAFYGFFLNREFRR